MVEGVEVLGWFIMGALAWSSLGLGELAVLCPEPEETLVIPWAHGSLGGELLFPGDCSSWWTAQGVG